MQEDPNGFLISKILGIQLGLPNLLLSVVSRYQYPISNFFTRSPDALPAAADGQQWALMKPAGPWPPRRRALDALPRVAGEGGGSSFPRKLMEGQNFQVRTTPLSFQSKME